ncbi:MAG: MerR family transcriptional regulator [Rickettsiaceae bacterium]|nr:MerR family transcriptional regulator [Rickettsiaceae bacterium]MDP5020180.1 MerR family transcriptional regulator [Rickettsiaceae bacterium]MDP5082924.1 MerR family transcriptional regulator [Rickettsiaceae bacterium]
MLTKKYFSIAETSKLSGLPTHKLRYIEKSDPNIEVIQIRGRRYYTKANIDYINHIYSTSLPNTPSKATINRNPKIIAKIDQLLTKFSKLAGID